MLKIDQDDIKELRESFEELKKISHYRDLQKLAKGSIKTMKEMDLLKHIETMIEEGEGLQKELEEAIKEYKFIAEEYYPLSLRKLRLFRKQLVNKLSAV